MLMATSAPAAGIRNVLGGLGKVRVLDATRALTFIGALLLVWISLRPFEDRGSLTPDAGGNETFTYALFGALAVFSLALTLQEDWRGLKTVLTPAFVLLGAWLAVNVVMSTDPTLSAKRLVLTVSVMAIAAVIMLLPRSERELSHWFAIAALVLLAVCYLGVLVAPQLSTHLATDADETHLAGNWRGAFGHKNTAAAVMAMLIFIGIFVMRAGSRFAGAAITGLALFFLVKTAGKSSLALTILVLLLSILALAVRGIWLRGLLLLTPLVLLNMLSVGTVMSPQLAELARQLPLDTSFTGRTDIWLFALQSLQNKPLTGYGLQAFWGTEALRNLPQGMEWAETAAHSHNGYLDSALTIGLPGLALLVIVLVIAPLKNLQQAERGGNRGPLLMLALQIWIFGLYLSALESFFLDRADPLWVTFLLGIFGLHYLARFRVAR